MVNHGHLSPGARITREHWRNKARALGDAKFTGLHEGGREECVIASKIYIACAHERGRIETVRVNKQMPHLLERGRDEHRPLAQIHVARGDERGRVPFRAGMH